MAHGKLNVIESLDFFLKRSTIVGECWIWNGAVAGEYAQVKVNYKQYPAHILAYTFKYGTAPKGTRHHHTCENKLCVNPDHVKPLTVSEHSKLHPRGKATRPNKSFWCVN
jgi:hypothetical protein